MAPLEPWHSAAVAARVALAWAAHAPLALLWRAAAVAAVPLVHGGSAAVAARVAPASATSSAACGAGMAGHFGTVPVGTRVKRDFMLRRCYVWDSDMLRQMSSPVLAS